jgi:hypothetical protein
MPVVPVVTWVGVGGRLRGRCSVGWRVRILLFFLTGRGEKKRLVSFRSSLECGGSVDFGLTFSTRSARLMSASAICAFPPDHRNLRDFAILGRLPSHVSAVLQHHPLSH